jgi:hypothetical protein
VCDVDLDCPLALNRYGFKLFGLDFDVLPFADFVADVGRIDLISRLRIHLAVSDAVAGLFVDLIEADFLSLAARGEQSNRTRDKRELQVAFPIGTRGHGGRFVAQLGIALLICSDRLDEQGGVTHRGCPTEKDYLVLKRASESRPSGEWNDDDYDVLAGGVVVGRIFSAKSLQAVRSLNLRWRRSLAGDPTL